VVPCPPDGGPVLGPRVGLPSWRTGQEAPEGPAEPTPPGGFKGHYPSGWPAPICRSHAASVCGGEPTDASCTGAGRDHTMGIRLLAVSTCPRSVTNRDTAFDRPIDVRHGLDCSTRSQPGQPRHICRSRGPSFCTDDLPSRAARRGITCGCRGRCYRTPRSSRRDRIRWHAVRATGGA
jgi:hypothetical protein